MDKFYTFFGRSQFDFWHQELFRNSYLDYCLAIVIALMTLFLFKIVLKIGVRQLERVSKRTKNLIDDTLIQTIDSIPHGFYNYVSMYAGLKFLILPSLVDKIINNLLLIILIFQIIKIVGILADFLLKRTKRRQNSTSIQGIKLILNILLWSTGVLLVLSNLGFNITALVASMGIGGIAVALAAQNILSDLFSSFMIYFDKPFEVGDYIVIGSSDGTVKKIGLKTTRLITPRGEELVMSNQELTSARIQNFKKLEKRRVDFTLGFEYETSNVNMKKVVPIVQSIVEKTENTEWFRGHFVEFADFSLNFKFSYYILSDEYSDYLEAHNAINFLIKEVFEKEKISMAFPTQTLHLVKS